MVKNSQYIFFLLLLSACASIRAPEGGDRDKIGPYLVKVKPDHLALNTRPKEVVFVYNEYLDPANAAKSIFISPIPETPPKVWVKNKRLHVQLGDSLLSNTTYVISVSTALQDFHERNPQQYPLTYAFSTGSKIDTGQVQGQLTYAHSNGPAAGFLVMLYDADSVQSTYLKKEPLYAAQADETGHFHLSFIRPGSYRILAVRDLDNSYSYSQPIEPVGVLEDNLLVINEDTSSWQVGMMAFTPDEVPPKVSNVLPSGPQALNIKWNEPIIGDIELSLNGDSLSTFRGKNNNSFIVGLPQPFDTTAFQLQIQVRDTAGNVTDTLLEVKPDADWAFTAKKAPAPYLYKSTHPLEKLLVLPGPVSSTLAQKFVVKQGDEPVDSVSWGFANKMTPTLRFSRYYEDSLFLHLKPDSLWGDTAVVIGFKLTDPEGLATLEVPVVTAHQIALQLYVGNVQWEEALRLPPGRHMLKWEHLPASDASISIVEDTDGNGAWTPGRMAPFRLSEKIYRVPEAIPLRANWEVVAPEVSYPPLR